MDDQRFWELLHNARLSELPDPEDWAERLQATLSQLEPDDIVDWNHKFDQLAKDAYTVDLMAACWVINGGAGDDGFYYFRCWLIGMGQRVFEAALLNPDSLADVVSPNVEAEAEIYAAAHGAWMAVTGNSDTDPYPARSESTELKGEFWDFNDEAKFKRRLPRLAKLDQ